MIVNGMRADELVNDANLIGNRHATGTWRMSTSWAATDTDAAYWARVALEDDAIIKEQFRRDDDGFGAMWAAMEYERELREALVKVANSKGESEATRLHARLLLLRASYREAQQAGRPLGQLVAQGKQVARRLASLGVRV